jgi:hypothetical protein
VILDYLTTNALKVMEHAAARTRGGFRSQVAVTAPDPRVHSGETGRRCLLMHAAWSE